MVSQTRLLYSAQSQLTRDFESRMRSVLSLILGIVNRYSDQGGVVPVRYARNVINESQEVLDQFYTGNGDPLSSEYGLMIFAFARQTMTGVAEAHRDYMTKRLSEPTISWLRGANFRPSYDPFHLWIDPNGRQLSDRIWSSALGARQKLDKYLTYNISQGTSSLRMARDLENMLLPNRSVLRTTRPYGVDVSFDSMRLARTEISRAHTETTFLASEVNPFVIGMDWALSAQHPRIDICDSLATIGMGGERIRPPYPLDQAPRVVQDSHPQCICNNRPSTGDDSLVIDELESMRLRGDPAPYSPLADVFTLLILSRLIQ